MSVLVVGSFMMDIITTTTTVPQPGQTVIGQNYNVFPGGKGINQAVSAKRLGSDVYMAGALGDDSYGSDFRNVMETEKINAQSVLTKDKRTGLGNVVLNQDTAENQIIVIPGANLSYTIDDLNKIDELVKHANVIVSQLEVSFDVVYELARICGKYHKKLILNPAPAAHLDEEIFKYVTHLTPNETELEILANTKITSEKETIAACQMLLDKGVKNVIVTLGSKGSIWVTKDFIKKHPGFKTKAIDTIGAGDSFNGALAYGLDNNLNVDEILNIANASGALCVTKHGAIPSIPNMEEVRVLLNKDNIGV